MFESFGAPRWVNSPASRPLAYDYLVQQGMTGVVIHPWRVLALDRVVSTTADLSVAFPEKRLVAFAKCCGSGELACWDADSSSRSVILHRSVDSCQRVASEVTAAESRSYGSLWGWFRTAADDFLQVLTDGDGVGSSDENPAVNRHGKQVPELMIRQPGPRKHFYSVSRDYEWIARLLADSQYSRLQDHLVTVTNWYPWRFLPGVDLVARSSTMHQVFPDRQFVVFAHNLQDDVLACWDSAQSDGAVYLIHYWYTAEPTRRITTYPDILQWFRHVVVEDFIAEGKRRVNLLRVED